MNVKNSRSLFKKYQGLFRPERGLHRSTMCFGFECGDEWHETLDNFLSFLSKVKDSIVFDDFEVTCVVESPNGSLRVGCVLGDDPPVYWGVLK